MTRVLLAEHSPHAQRMAEHILRDEGYAVTTVTDGETAMLRLKDVKPRLVLADVALRGFSGFQICEHVKTSGEYPDSRVVLTLGALELLDQTAADRAQADGLLRKPFEASALLDLAAKLAPPSAETNGIMDRTEAGETAMRPTRSVVVLDPEQVRAAVTVALDEEFPRLIERVTDRVVAALGGK